MALHLRRRAACLAVGAATLVASGALAAQSSAAQIALGARCYLHTERADSKVGIAGAGFFPGTTVDISGKVFGSADVDANGNFLVAVDGPTDTVKPGARKFTVKVSDDNFDTGQTITASASAYYSAAGVDLSDNDVGFGKRITYSFGGFRPGHQIYGHYFIGKRLVGRKRFGRAAGPCGTLRARATAYPVSSAHPNKWSVYFDSVKKFAKRALPTFVYHFHKILL